MVAPILARAAFAGFTNGGGSGRRGNTLVIEGIETTKDNLARMLPGEAQKILRRTVGAVAALIRNDIRLAIPANVRHYRTAIAVYRPRLRRGQVAADVVAKRTPPRAFYIHNIIEHGTRDRFTKSGAYRGSVTAQPFKGPVVERWRPKVAAAFETALYAELAAAWERRRTGKK